MKHKITLLAAGTLTLSLLLCACGGPDDASKPSETPSPSVSQNSGSPEPSNSAQITAPTEEPSQGGEDAQSPAPESPSNSETPAPADTAPNTSSPAADIETARSFIDKSVEELIAAIGEPVSTDYAPSCLGSGEDGELIYDGFTVYTYREGNTETVQDVL